MRNLHPMQFARAALHNRAAARQWEPGTEGQPQGRLFNSAPFTRRPMAPAAERESNRRIMAGEKVPVRPAGGAPRWDPYRGNWHGESDQPSLF